MGDIQKVGDRGVQTVLGFDITIGGSIYSSVFAPAMLGLSIVIKVIAPWVQEQHAVDLVDGHMMQCVWSPVQEHALPSPDPEADGSMSVEIYQFVFILALCTILHKCTSIRGLCVCEAHLSICVDSVAPRASAPGVGKAGSRELLGHQPRPLSAACAHLFCYHSTQTDHFVIPSAAQMLLMIDLSRCFISWKTF